MTNNSHNGPFPLAYFFPSFSHPLSPSLLLSHFLFPSSYPHSPSLFTFPSFHFSLLLCLISLRDSAIMRPPVPPFVPSYNQRVIHGQIGSGNFTFTSEHDWFIIMFGVHRSLFFFFSQCPPVTRDLLTRIENTLRRVRVLKTFNCSRHNSDIFLVAIPIEAGFASRKYGRSCLDIGIKLK